LTQGRTKDRDISNSDIRCAENILIRVYHVLQQCLQVVRAVVIVQAIVTTTRSRINEGIAEAVHVVVKTREGGYELAPEIGVTGVNRGRFSSESLLKRMSKAR
jgi:hypothetical protein